MDELISLLKIALNEEWKAALQYFVHASQIVSMNKENLAEHLKEHANDEIEHAEKLAVHFFAKGIEIDIQVPDIETSSDVLEMIKQDVQGEIDTINRYVKIIELCEDNPQFIDTKMVIEDILLDEIEHHDDGVAFIKKNLSEKNYNSDRETASRLASTLLKSAGIMEDRNLFEDSDDLINRVEKILSTNI